MIVLDANIFIYLANGTLKGSIISDYDVAYASITKIEILGYPRIQANELILLTEWLDASYDIELTDSIIDRAVRLRQQKKISLGDAITAASALEFDAELWTANTKDFMHIDGLKLHNPM